MECAPVKLGHAQGFAARRIAHKLAAARVLAHVIMSPNWCIADNAGSVRVLEKLGMQHEGRLREKDYFMGRWWDTLLYAILDQEWHARADTTGTSCT
jgi:L-amino acid N-acyltransferase YncA